MSTLLHRAGAALAVVLFAVLTVAGCTGSGSSGASAAKSAAHSAEANPTISNELNVEEQLLLNNLQNNFSPAHPVKSVEDAVRLTFPKGNLSEIEKFAVKTFTLSVLHTKGPGSARDNWLMGVVANAQSTQGAGTPAAPSPSVKSS